MVRAHIKKKALVGVSALVLNASLERQAPSEQARDAGTAGHPGGAAVALAALAFGRKRKACNAAEVEKVIAQGSLCLFIGVRPSAIDRAGPRSPRGGHSTQRRAR